MNIKTGLILVLFLFAFSRASSQVKLPGIFGDHMVVQRNQPVPVWGWSSPNEKVTVRFNSQTKVTIADQKGHWRVTLDSQPAGGPFDLSVTGHNQTVFHDVMIGEVWICSGQSNMEFELNSVINADQETQSAIFPEIRQIKIPHEVSNSPKDNILPAPWEKCSPATAGNFTAVGYFFAREIVKRLHVPVGLINSSWGGTMSETWTSRGAFENSAEFKSMIAQIPVKNFEATVEKRRNNLEQQILALHKNTNDTVQEEQWKNPDYNSQNWPKISVANIWESQDLGLTDLDGVVWYRKEVVLEPGDLENPVVLSLGMIDDNDITYVNGVRVGSTKSYNTPRVYHVPAGVFKSGKNVIAVRVEDTGGGGGFYGDSSLIHLKTESKLIPLGDPWRFRIAKILDNGIGVGPNDFPCLLYNAMIHPLIPFSIRGVLWYQGEANAGRAFQYRSSFPLLITDWRQQWGEGNFPFYFVQLASFNADNGNSNVGSEWAELREAQSKTLSLPATGMAVTVDIGQSNDIHPKNKQDVGRRLAAIALDQIYGLKMEYSGPVYLSKVITGNKVVLDFSHKGSGLMLKDKYGYIRGFEIAGSDRHFHYARALIQNNKVIVSADQVDNPQSVRYAWADDAGDANLYNQEGFPAVPFRTDEWPGKTDKIKYSAAK
jgi:sialate O-acetylesterase